MIREKQARIAFFGGKGGVGKTTLSSAFALNAARSGRKTLLVSTDPAHNLHDMFGCAIGRTPTRLEERLWAMEIDPHYESHLYMDSVKSNIRSTVGAAMYQEIERQVEIARLSPGAEEAALFDKMVELILNARGEYDQLVFDTAPTGHTLRLMSLPELMGAWIDGMVRRRGTALKMRETLLEEASPQEDPVYRILTERKLKFAAARDVLLDAGQTAFIFVLIPERLPLEETQKALPVLEKYRMPVRTLIVNRILPEQADGEFLKARKEQELMYLREIEERFKKLRLVRIPMQERDVCGIRSLERIAESLRGIEI